MGSKSNYLELELLDHVLGGADYTRPATVYAALYSALPGESGGGTELTGGSYARVAITNNNTNWPAASGGAKSNGTVITFPTATADWSEAIGWALLDASSGGNLLYYGALAGARKEAEGATDDTLTSVGHGLADGTRVRLEQVGGFALPAGLSANTTYYVRDATTDTLKLAATLGGAAIDITAVGIAYLVEWKSRTCMSGDTMSFAAGALTITED